MGQPSSLNPDQVNALELASSPWAVVASLPFEPEVILKTIQHAIEKLDLKKHNN